MGDYREWCGMTIEEKRSRSRVNGFLRAKGREIVNGKGEPVLLSGWGLGNWLLCEGYMWKAGPRADRPRRLEQVIRELAGSSYAESFWPRFRENYIRREDILRMAQMGYNSVRLPINWRVLMEDEPGIHWKENGFCLIDSLLDWCEEAGLYVFLDLHGAPGGQTGANIDDCVDDFPRLFTDRDSWDKAIALWGELARRYHDRWIVGGYDLLNEPLRPDDGRRPCQYLLPRLRDFYIAAIAEVRRHDKVHMLSIEGSSWSTDPAVFCLDYDDNMVIHFHRYAVFPDTEAYREFLALAERWNKPLWLGESGENTPEWFAALYPLGTKLGVGFNVWPWKKMDCKNSPYSVKLPKGWEKFTAYTKGGERPTYEEAQDMLEEYLRNMLLEHCEENPAVSASVLREPGCSVRATDFDPDGCFGFCGTDAVSGYQKGSGMCITEPERLPEKRFGFDCCWDSYKLKLRPGEYAEYTFYHAEKDSTVSMKFAKDSSGTVEIFQDGSFLGEASGSDHPFSLSAAAQTVIRVRGKTGEALLERLIFA